MLTSKSFVAQLKEKGFNFFTGVPCSLLSGVISCLDETEDVSYIPAVRERELDSKLLLQHFLSFYAESMRPIKLDAESERAWVAYSFPGNVRELRNIVIRLCTKYPGQVIGVDKLKIELEQPDVVYGKVKHEIFNSILIQQKISEGDLNLNSLLQEFEDNVIHQAMILYKGNISKVAKALKINRTTLYSRMQKNEFKT